jgi:peptidoglycan/LPS O-acetylase OafA/YrhL
MEHILKFGMTLICFVISVLVAQFISRQKSFSFLSHRQGRYGSIDGLRGFLAISVLFHHFIITWYWKVNGRWTRPPEDYYQNYGKVSVALFFMITGFLFIFKIMKENGKINWFEFYESRIFRIFPLYIFAVIIITLIIFYRSDFELKVSFLEIIKQYAQWGIFYGNTINNFADTKTIIAQVDWTLKYEWIFYISLPVLARIIMRLKQVGSLFLLVLSILLFQKPIQFYLIDTGFFIFFAIGGFSAYVNKYYEIPDSIIKSKLISSITLVSVVSTIFYPITFDSVHVALISLFFILVVLGNDMFGIFSLKSSVLLGEISYSIYLLHGIILYLVFSVFDIAVIETFSLQEYLIFMPLICVSAIFISAYTFILIEKPSINLGRKYILSRILRSFINRV